jgi:hypothetical protein
VLNGLLSRSRAGGRSIDSFLHHPRAGRGGWPDGRVWRMRMAQEAFGPREIRAAEAAARAGRPADALMQRAAAGHPTHGPPPGGAEPL